MFTYWHYISSLNVGRLTAEQALSLVLNNLSRKCIFTCFTVNTINNLNGYVGAKAQ